MSATICMYIYIYVCMYVCMYVYIICISLCVYIYMYLSLSLSLSVEVYYREYTNIHSDLPPCKSPTVARKALCAHSYPAQETVRVQGLSVTHPCNKIVWTRLMGYYAPPQHKAPDEIQALLGILGPSSHFYNNVTIAVTILCDFLYQLVNLILRPS